MGIFRNVILKEIVLLSHGVFNSCKLAAFYSSKGLTSSRSSLDLSHTLLSISTAIQTSGPIRSHHSCATVLSRQ